MVQTYQAPTKTYHYPFDIVMEAYEKRFPSCELIPIFVDSEVLEETSADDNNLKIIKRRCKVKVDAPYLLKKIIGLEHANFIQINTLNIKSKVLKIEAFNEHYTSRLEMNEICYYRVHPDNSLWTTFDQEATLNIKSFFNFEAALEKVIIKHYISNIGKGKEVLLHFINEMENKGHLVKHSSANSIDMANDKSNYTSRSSFRKHSACNSSGFIYLTPLQENKLALLKTMLKEKHSSKVPNDAHLLRFLKARDFGVEKACEMLVQSLIWRKHHQIDKIISSYLVPEVILKYFPASWLPPNKHYSPIYCLKLGETDIKGLYSSLGMDGIIKHVLYVCEQGLQFCQERYNSGSIIATTPFNTKSESNDPLNLITSDSSSHKRSPSKESLSRGSLTSLPTNFALSQQRPCCYAWNLLLDLRGLGVRHLWTPGIKAILKVVELAEANYPETLNAVWVVGAPWIFPVVWTLVSPFIDETTREKFIFLDNNTSGSSSNLQSEDREEFAEGSESHVDGNVVSSSGRHPSSCSIQNGGGEEEGASLVPDMAFIESVLNSDNMCSGGMVPKSYYLSESALNNQNNAFKDNIYHTILLSKGQLHEVIIEVKEHGTVLTWDFDVARHECTFQVLYTPLPLDNIKMAATCCVPATNRLRDNATVLKEGNTGHNGAPSSDNGARNSFSFNRANTNTLPDGAAKHKYCERVRVATHSGHSSSVQTGTGQPEQEPNCLVLNEAITCREGEGVQGSHFVKHPGCYVLQWQLPDTFVSPKPPNTPFDFSSLTIPKCKLMYFYEIIHPDIFKGSMSSLHSVTSGFSSLNTTDFSFNHTSTL